MKNPFLGKVSSVFSWFFSYIGFKFPIAILLSTLVGMFDGLGLTMFLPLLKLLNSEQTNHEEGLQGYRFLSEMFDFIGVDINIGSVLLCMSIFFALKGIIKYSSLVFRAFLQEGLITAIRINLLYSLNNMSFIRFVASDAGMIQNTMTSEVDRIQQSYILYFTTLEQVILVFMYLSFAFYLNFEFALLVCLGVVLTSIFFKRINRYTTKSSKEFSFQTNDFQGKLMQHVINFKYLRATAMMDDFTDRLHQNISEIESSRRRLNILSAMLEALREPVLIGILSSVIFIQVIFLEGSFNSILISLLFFYRALTSLILLQNTWNKFLGVSGSLDNLREFQKYLSENFEVNGNNKFSSLKSDIQLKDVSFRYSQNELILKNISITIKKNKTIAFVGQSGSGKTTIVNLIVGLLLPFSGQILVDGKSMNNLDRISFQKRIGYITQEPVIFNDTIFNNVTFWAPRTPENEKRCIEALRKSLVYDFVIEQPHNLDTVLGNNGMNLSGGQKQRISIARELFKDIDILVMDEATSALDGKTEELIQKNIDSLKGQYTMLIIAHRLSTIKNSDSIVLINEGTISEEGNYQDLIRFNSRFSKMFKSQVL